MNFQSLIVSLLLDSKKFIEGLEAAQKKASEVTQGLANIGKGIAIAGIAGATAVVGSLTAGIVSSVSKTSEWSNTLDSIQDVLGGTSSEAAGLASMMKTIGGDSSQVSDAMAKMANGLLDAKGQLGLTGIALKNLGISAYDTNGNIKDSYDLFAEVSSIVAKMPDGLDKTSVMMDIFGKSGKEMGDALSAAADGGLADFTQQAEDMGLAIDPQPVIDMQKAQAKFGLTLDGLKISLGRFAIPLLTTLSNTFTTLLSNPAVQNGLATIGQAVSTFAEKIISGIPQVITWFQNVYDWLSNNQGVIIGVLAALGVAVGFFVYTSVIPALVTLATTFATTFAVPLAIMAAVGLAVYALYQAWNTNFLGIRDTLTTVWETNLKPIFETVKTWLEVNIPKGIDILKGFWDNTFIPALENVKSFIDENIVPIFNTVVGWLSENIPVAIDTVSGFFNNTLLPAITGIWKFINDPLLPLFKAVADFFNAAFSLAITALAGLWENVLYPKLHDIWDLISTKLQPVFETLSDFWSNTLGPALQTVYDTILSKLPGVFDSIKNAVGWVIDKINALTSALKSVKLPDWLIPGSPTPFELGLLGINDAMSKLNSTSLPTFKAKLDLGEMSTIATKSTSAQSTSNITLSDKDMRKLERSITVAVLKGLT